MLKETFQTREDYLKYVKNVLLFTHLRSYDSGASLWKKEDLQSFKNVNEERHNKEKSSLFWDSLDVYLKAYDGYGKAVREHNGWFGTLSADKVLSAFGFNSPSSDADDFDENYVMAELDIFDKLKPNDNFPKSFPVVAVIGDGEFKVEHIYLSDFQNNIKNEDFSWLEENIRDFWSGKNDL